MRELAEIQRRFYDWVTVPPQTTDAPPGLNQHSIGEAIALSSDRVSADSGLLGTNQTVDVYSQMYFGRLHDVLAEDFPKLRASLGEDTFRALATSYVRARPPTSFTIRDCGTALSDYLATRPDLPAWSSNLAALERAFVDAFHGEDAVVLARTDLVALSPDQFADFAIRWVPASAIVVVEWNVDDLWSSIDSSAALAAAPEPGNRTIVVWRRDLKILHRTLDSDEAHLAPMLAQPTSLATVSGTLAELGRDAPEHRMVELLARWLDAEMLAG